MTGKRMEGARLSDRRRPSFWGWCYGLFMALSLLVCLCAWGRVPYLRADFSRVFLTPWLLLPAGVCALFALRAVSALIGPRLRHGRLLLLLASLGLFFFQIAAVSRYYFLTDWDVETVLDLSYTLAHGMENTAALRYFSMYPNNLLLVWFYTRIREATMLLGLERFEYLLLLVPGCAANALTGALLVLLLRELGCMRAQLVFGYALYVLLLGFSPWVSIPYSDSLVLPLPCLTAWLALRRKEGSPAGRVLRWLLIGLLTWLGYCLKPQTVAVAAAVLLRGLFTLSDRDARRRALLSVPAFAAGLLLSALLCSAATGSLRLALDPEAAFSPTHYLMMGVNSESMGSFSKADVEFSASLPTRAERSAANLRVALERVRALGLKGLARLAVQKTLTNFGDGTFCWDGEGVFYYQAVERSPSRLNSFFQNLYYSRDWMGKYFPLWANAVQLLWLPSLLFGCIAAWLPGEKRRDCVMLALLALGVFELLCEARSRYLFSFAPLYLTLAVCALEGPYRLLRRKG